ncbi:hypothetical protein ABTG96_19805, partial [Acinetobacter baumannii]
SEQGSLEALVTQADSIKGKTGEKFRDHLPMLPMTRELVTIKCDVPLAQAPADLALHAADTDALRQLYAELDFRSWLNELTQA